MVVFTHEQFISLAKERAESSEIIFEETCGYKIGDYISFFGLTGEIVGFYHDEPHEWWVALVKSDNKHNNFNLDILEERTGHDMFWGIPLSRG
jgi:hypothetical protein